MKLVTCETGMQSRDDEEEEVDGLGDEDVAAGVVPTAAAAASVAAAQRLSALRSLVVCAADRGVAEIWPRSWLWATLTQGGSLSC